MNEAGVVAGVAVGTVSITATSEGRTGTSQLSVSAVDVASVAVDPPTASLVVGGTVDLVATAKNANGATLAGRAPTWSSSNAGVATVNARGNVTGVAAGTASITAAIEGRTGSAAITVAQATVASVEVSPGEPTLAAGQTVQLTATARSAGGQPVPGRTATWTTSASAAATVNATGLVTGVAAGTATITATVDGVAGTTTVTVTVASGIIRTWKGGATGKATDWTAPANWTPAGVPIPLDTVRVPVTTAAPVLQTDVQISRLILAGGRLRTAGFRLNLRAR